MNETIITMRQAADVLGIKHANNIYKYVRRNHFKPIAFNQYLLQDVIDYMDRRTSSKPTLERKEEIEIAKLNRQTPQKRNGLCICSKCRLSVDSVYQSQKCKSCIQKDFARLRPIIDLVRGV